MKFTNPLKDTASTALTGIGGLFLMSAAASFDADLTNSALDPVWWQTAVPFLAGSFSLAAASIEVDDSAPAQQEPRRIKAGEVAHNRSPMLDHLER